MEVIVSINDLACCVADRVKVQNESVLFLSYVYEDKDDRNVKADEEFDRKYWRYRDP